MLCRTLVPELIPLSVCGLYCISFRDHPQLHLESSCRAMDEVVEDADAHWRRLGRLGFRAGLREAGFSENVISAIINYKPWLGDRISELFRDDEMVDILSTVENGRAALLAVLGRGRSSPALKSLGARGEYSARSLLDESEAASLCANLSSNLNLKELDISQQVLFGGRKGCALLGNALMTNACLEHLELQDVGMGSEAVRCLMDRLRKRNKALVSLDLSRNPLLDEGIAYIAEFLCSNATLKCLDVSWTGSNFEGAKHLSFALERNITLETLKFSGNSKIGKNGMRLLLEPLSSDGHLNTTLKELELGSMGELDSSFSPDSVARMIRTNKTLSKLDIAFASLLTKDWEDQILPALSQNETLKELSLVNCRGLTGEGVQDALMELLQCGNSGLGQIQLGGTGMESWQGRVDEELRMNREYRGRLRGQTRSPATSGRLLLCGYQSAGKTAIRKTMERIVHGTPWWKTLRTTFGRDVHNELADKTRGFDVTILNNLNKQPHRIQVWDWAGQKEQYILHDYLFPDVQNACVLYICNPHDCHDRQNSECRLKSQFSMREECEYWMRFLASKSKPHQLGGDGHAKLPHARFVLTNKDTLSSTKLDVARQRAERAVVQFKEVFKDVIDLCETVEVINAHSSEDVERLMKFTNSSLKEVLAHQTEYAICEVVRNVLDEWSAKNRSRPLLGLQDFYTLWDERLKSEATISQSTSKESLECALAYMNDLGEIIFPKGSSLIVANPRWFGVGVVGFLIDAFRGGAEHLRQPKKASMCTALFNHRKPIWKLEHHEGIVARDILEYLLGHSLQTMHLNQTIPSEMLIELMIQMEMCFEKEPGKVDSPLFIPALFDDERERAATGTRPVEWKLERNEPFTFLGRRLECQNKSVTFLTPGFFPRLQVHLCNYIHKRKWTGNAGFAVERNLICFADNGIEVCVEYSGERDHFMDIMVRSSRPSIVALKFVEDHVVKTILQFCASPQGCQGVLLVEAAIRPVCVRNLHLCVDRKVHSVPVSNLRSHLEVDHGYVHTWSHKIEDEKDTNFALDLLEGEGSYLSFLAANQVDLGEKISSSISSARHFRHKNNLSLQRQLPKLFYPFIEDVGILRKMEARMNLAKVMRLEIHLMCEAKGRPHIVEGQPGRMLKLNWKAGGNNLPLMKFATILLWAEVSSGEGSVDSWVQKLLDVPAMPITVEKLIHLVSHGQSSGQVSEQDILKVLENYRKVDPSTQWLKGFLNLQDVDQFWRDFCLQKVVYTVPTYSNQIAWLCERHFQSGVQQGTLRSAPA